MLTYFTARKAEKVFTEYKALVVAYWKALESSPELKMRGRSLPRAENHDSATLREQIAHLFQEAEICARTLGLSVTAQSYPAPMVGGPVLPVNVLFAAIAPREGHSTIPRQTVLDTINRCLGMAARRRKELFWRQLVNPLWWATEIVAYILRLPFLILRKAGLPAVVEESIWGHVVKVAVFIALLLASLHWGLKLSAKNLLDFVK